MGAGDGAIFTRGTVTAGGFRVSYLQGGAQRDLDPVLFIHGLGGGGKWESFHMALGTVTFTIAPNLPGWPGPQPPRGITNVRDYAGVMVGLLDALNIARAVVVGHSVGGWIAGYLASEHPERVARLVLIDALGLDLPEAPAVDLAALDEDGFAARVFGKLGLVATAQAYGFGAEWQNVRQGPEFERQWKGRGLVAALTGGPCADPGFAAALAAIRQDTLIMWGRLDGIAGITHAAVLQRLIPGGRLRVFEKAGHLPTIEQPETANRLVRDFLLGLDSPLPGVTNAV
jgi:pimeloyl-ACP methyl ester carboxylesterase